MIWPVSGMRFNAEGVSIGYEADGLDNVRPEHRDAVAILTAAASFDETGQLKYGPISIPRLGFAYNMREYESDIEPTRKLEFIVYLDKF